jgi:hypothetical protein
METTTGSDFEKLVEQHYVEAYASFGECVCTDERRLHVALSETRATAKVFAPDHIGIPGARCATFGRCK